MSRITFNIPQKVVEEKVGEENPEIAVTLGKDEHGNIDIFLNGILIAWFSSPFGDLVTATLSSNEQALLPNIRFNDSHLSVR